MSNENILIVDDDLVFCQVMQRALTRRGYTVDIFQSATGAVASAKNYQYSKAIVDLKIARESGLHLIKELKVINTDIKIVMLTGYSSITTAVEAIKLGAVNYFCKPVDVDDILQAFSNTEVINSSLISEAPTSLDRIEWEHIQKTLQDNAGNISLTARMLGMHRRTLQRKLLKKPVAN